MSIAELCRVVGLEEGFVNAHTDFLVLVGDNLNCTDHFLIHLKVNVAAI